MKEAVEEKLAGEIQSLKAMIETSNATMNKLSEDMARQAEAGKMLQAKMDATSASIKTVKHDVGSLQKELRNLRQKVSEMEDRSRRSNIRLVGLPESAEGGNPIQFLQLNLPVWIPSLTGIKIEIQRAHRIFTSRDKTNRPSHLRRRTRHPVRDEHRHPGYCFSLITATTPRKGGKHSTR